MGDDHVRGSTRPPVEFAFVDLDPGAQPGRCEILDYGILASRLRYAGVGRPQVREGQHRGHGGGARSTTSSDPRGSCGGAAGSNRLAPGATAERVHDYKRAAILAWPRQQLDRIITSVGRTRVGIITCGKSYLDIRGRTGWASTR
jgi:hypothetical protein